MPKVHLHPRVALYHMTEAKSWTVTYTKHVKQKRKVYHDGELKVSATRKILLYDDCKNLIDSRFLKQDDILECGATLAFEAHLVDIGELEGDQKPQTCPNVRKRFESSGEQGQKNSAGNKIKHGSSGVLQSRPDAAQTALKEWNALYTTQKTQKAKRYHDGVLRLADCGSHMNQVILLNEDGAVLSSKYLKSVECVGAGHTCEFPNYLVEIGGPRGSLGDDTQKKPSRQDASSSSSSIHKFNKKDRNKPLHKKLLPNEDPRKGNPEQAVGCDSSNSQKLPTSSDRTRNQQLRDACQIMSVLKKPLPEENLDKRKLPAEYANSSSDSVQFVGDSKREIVDLTVPGTSHSKRTALDNHKGDFHEAETRGTTQADNLARPSLNSKTTQVVPTTGVTVLIESGYEDNPPTHEYHISSNKLSGTLEHKTSSDIVNLEYTGSGCVGITSSTAGPEISDTNNCSLPIISQEIASVSICYGGLSREPVDGASDLPSLVKASDFFSNGKQQTAKSSSSTLKENISAAKSGYDISNIGNTHCGASIQDFSETRHPEERLEKVPSSVTSLPAWAATDHICKDSVSQSLSKMDNLPTFDLGF